MHFTFATPPRVVVGWGAATDERLVAETTRLGQRPLIVAGNSLRQNGTLNIILRNLGQAGMSPTVHEGVPPEPDITALQSAMEAAEAARADCVLAIGGGSALDVGKGAAALAGRGVSAADYFTGKQTMPETGGLPILAVPTTAGTGSEATWVGVFVDKSVSPPRKASIRGGAMMPAIALLDAQLTVSCPPRVTACSGMDAFVQAVEAYTSVGANPLTDGLSLEAARLTDENLYAAYEDGSDNEARAAMLLGSYMAGAALNTSRLGLVHGLAHPIGAITGAPHGLLCGLLMPPVIRFNADAAAARYEQLVYSLSDLSRDSSSESDPEFLARHVEAMLRDMEVPTRLSEIGLTEADLDYVAREAMNSGSTKANPRPVAMEEARAVAAACL